MTHFDPSLTATADAGIFGLPYSSVDSKVILLPVPWEVTTSYGGGTSRGPDAVLHASPQIDLFDVDFGKAYECGFFMKAIPHDQKILSDQLKAQAQVVINELEVSQSLSEPGQKILAEVNEGCQLMVDEVRQESQNVLDQGKVLGVIGGDHSVPLGAIQAVSEKTKGDFGILHVDAHFDLRQAYQGFTHSHASIMYNVMQLPQAPKKLVQVGIRDFCEEEYELMKSDDRILGFLDSQIQRALFQGKTWSQIIDKIIEPLPETVYVSIDIDGLSPVFGPHTGTPVPGGLSFNQATELLVSLVRSGRKIIAFDLVEVAPGTDPNDEWDGNVGSRLLYKMCGLSAVSRGWASLNQDLPDL